MTGPSGTGKTTIAELLGKRLGWRTAEADEFHPHANIEKMSGGEPLDDEDRWPWLEGIQAFLNAQLRKNEHTIVTCSALKRSYRDLLRQSSARVVFVQLWGPIELIASRMNGRKGHFMPEHLLQSQFDALEGLQPDEQGLVADVSSTPEEIVEHIVNRLNLEHL